MELKINLDKLLELNLIISEYTYLYLKYKFNNLDINKYWNTLEKLNLEKLEKLGYIKQTEDDIVLRQKAVDLFVESTPETKFVEFYSVYPFKVPNGSGGYRVIRSKDINSKQAIELKAKYLKLIKTPGMHEIIIKGLHNYIRSLRPTLQFIVGIEVFINSHLWERYCDLDDEIQDIITEAI